MGIFRAGVRVTRALSPAPSTSCSDDEELGVQNHKVRKTSEKCSEAAYLQCVPNDASDLYQVGESTCQLPDELFELTNLGDILSLQSWNERLSEKERQRLGAYLPDMDHETFQKTLKELLSAQNMYFGSPMEHLWQQLEDGFCNPTVVKSRQTFLSLQKGEYYHDLRRYHNGMVNSLMVMRDLWMSNPEANVEKKLISWNEGRSSKTVCTKGLTAFEDRGKKICVSRPSGSSNDDLLGRTDFTPDSKPTLNSGNEELALHSDLELSQASMEQISNEVDADRSETRSICKMNSSFRDSPLSTGLQLKRKCLSQGGLDCRSKQRKHLKGNRKEARALVSRVYESATPFRSENGGDRDSGLNASGRIESSAGTHPHVNKQVFDKQASLSFRRDWAESHVIKLMKNAQSTFVPPLTPGFTFSTLYFLSAVRALFFDEMTSNGVECLPFKEIVARVEACPGDLRVLRAQLPLDCMVRGALKVLASTSKSAARDYFKPLVSYDKARRYWSWVGPVSGRLCSFKEVELQAMSEVWSISAAILNELLDSFEKWLKSMERTLQQLWHLSQVPLPAFPVFPDEKERFRDLRAQKNSTTVPPCSYEMRALFQKEERVRYSTLEIAFRYTTADGQKSAVVPLKKLGGKSKAKARDHFMLRSDRPSHITILSLVRDAAARLPQGIGTRADVCMLLRDSQYIKDVLELQLTQVVSGALDRLHYEKDPCVRFDQDKKLWLYLHGEREEEDFEEGGTTSTRSSRRSKRDGVPATVSPVQGNTFDDDVSEPEPDSSSFNGDDARKSASPEFLYEHHQNVVSPSLVRGAGGVRMREEVLLPFIDVPASMQPFCTLMQSHPMGWEVYKAGKELPITLKGHQMVPR
ncbi:hypothetical protein L7F22_014237 [Adiantum nelumboides]|nr:hypothetical protein [Adiantum nelumboides]